MSRPPLGNTLDIGGLSIAWYSLLITIGAVLAIILAMREEKRLKLPKDTVLNFALLALPLGLIGARLYFVAFSWNRYANDLAEIFRIWNGGLAIYGGVIGALLAAYLVTRKQPKNFFTLLDACAPGFVLAQAIGRWGNYANMEAYGARIYDEAWQFFPIAVEIKLIGAGGTEYWYWHMATFFYESILCFAIFLFLWSYRKKAHRRGDSFAWYVLLYCAGRTVIEGLRDDSLLMNVSAAQVRISQILSAVACLVVVIVFFVRLVRKRKLHLGDYFAWGIVIVGIACTFVGEFERNAYQMLFTYAQILLGALLLLDIMLIIHYVYRSRRFGGYAVWLTIAAGTCILMLLQGIGRMGESNIAFIAFRQAVAMLHVVLGGVWFYLRTGKPKLPADEKVVAENIVPAMPDEQEAAPPVEADEDIFIPQPEEPTVIETPEEIPQAPVSKAVPAQPFLTADEEVPPVEVIRHYVGTVEITKDDGPAPVKTVGGPEIVLPVTEEAHGKPEEQEDDENA